MIYDRLQHRYIDDSEVPCEVFLGRYAIEKDGALFDLTNRNTTLGNKCTIHQTLLEEKSQNLQELILQIASRYEYDWTSCLPLIQKITDKFELNPFEELLIEDISHLKEICRSPHYVLDRSLVKVNASKAKRIPQKSYEHLASHTEDWYQKSILGFKPRKIIHEELDLNYVIYENRLFVALIHRILRYLNARLQEIRDISAFQSKLQECLSSKKYDKGWWVKNNRNFILFGSVTKDVDKNDYGKVLNSTAAILYGLKKDLIMISGTELFSIIKERQCKDIVYHDSNVLIGHKHYRHLKQLWFRLGEKIVDRTDEQKKAYEQEVLSGLRTYVASLARYTVQNGLGYQISGDCYNWTAKKTTYSDITFHINEDKSMTLSVGPRDLCLLAVSDMCNCDVNIDDDNTYLVALSDSVTYMDDNIIHVSPYDVDSPEAFGLMIRKHLLKDYCNNILSPRKYPSKLRDFVKYFPLQEVRFDTRSDEYTIIGIARSLVLKERIKIDLEQDPIFKKYNKFQKSEVLTAMEQLIDTIKNEMSVIPNQSCFYDSTHSMNLRAGTSLHYMTCQTCNFTVSFNENGHYSMINGEPKYRNLTQSDWGMDYVSI